VATCLRWGG